MSSVVIKADIVDIPEVCIETMAKVYYGGYILDFDIGNRLFLVQSLHPEFIEIFNPPENLSGEVLFAARLTEQGKEWIDRLFLEKLRDEGFLSCVQSIDNRR